MKLIGFETNYRILPVILKESKFDNLYAVNYLHILHIYLIKGGKINDFIFEFKHYMQSNSHQYDIGEGGFRDSENYTKESVRGEFSRFYKELIQ